MIASGFGIPNALKFNSKGQLHVLDVARDEIQRVNVDDSSVMEIQANGALRLVSQPGLSKPGGIAVIGDSVWVADHYALVELDAQSGETLSYQTSIIGHSQLAEPQTVAPYSDHLLLTSYFRPTVQVWDPKAEEAVATYHQFAVPLNAIGYRGSIAVAEGKSVRVSLLDESGEISVLADNFELPIGLATQGDDLFVGDYLAGTITRITPQGTRTIMVQNLAGPEGLAFTNEGILLVVETKTRRLLAADLTTGTTTVIAQDLPLGAVVPGPLPPEIAAPSFLFNGVTVASDGLVYLTGDVRNVVIRIDLSDCKQ